MTPKLKGTKVVCISTDKGGNSNYSFYIGRKAIIKVGIVPGGVPMSLEWLEEYRKDPEALLRETNVAPERA